MLKAEVKVGDAGLEKILLSDDDKTSGAEVVIETTMLLKSENGETETKDVVALAPETTGDDRAGEG
jgi:hypothetical protein